MINKFWKLIENLCQFFLLIMQKNMRKEFKEETKQGILQFIKFGIVGASNTILSYVLYVVSLWIFQRFPKELEWDYMISQFFSFFLSVLWSFYWNNKMVFIVEEGQKRSIWKTLIKTYISYSFTGLFLNSILLVIWIRILGISEYIAPLVNLLISVPANFLINKFWAYK